jgi:hypothetical protein
MVEKYQLIYNKTKQSQVNQTEIFILSRDVINQHKELNPAIENIESMRVKLRVRLDNKFQAQLPTLYRDASALLINFMKSVKAILVDAPNDPQQKEIAEKSYEQCNVVFDTLVSMLQALEDIPSDVILQSQSTRPIKSKSQPDLNPQAQSTSPTQPQSVQPIQSKSQPDLNSQTLQTTPPSSSNSNPVTEPNQTNSNSLCHFLHFYSDDLMNKIFIHSNTKITEFVVDPKQPETPQKEEPVRQLSKHSTHTLSLSFFLFHFLEGNTTLTFFDCDHRKEKNPNFCSSGNSKRKRKKKSKEKNRKKKKRNPKNKVIVLICFHFQNISTHIADISLFLSKEKEKKEKDAKPSKHRSVLSLVLYSFQMSTYVLFFVQIDCLSKNVGDDLQTF